MALSATTGTITFPGTVTVKNGDSITVTWEETSTNTVVWPTISTWSTTTGGTWLERPKTSAEIIDEFARAMAARRPARD